MVILLLACSGEPPAEVHFVRGGVLRGGTFTARDWTPGETVDGTAAPQTPECVPVVRVELEDMRKSAAMGAPLPGMALAFSSDGRLAAGSEGGTVLVVDTTGKERARTRLSEAAVKQVAWSEDGDTLYVGEQSPDAFVYAMDPTTLAVRWRVRLADDLETSAPPPKDDIYGIYSLPAAFHLAVLADGSLLVAGAHGWNDEAGRHNRSRLYRLAADGSRQGAWPADGAADAIMLRLAQRGSRVLVPLSRSADGPAPDLPIGGVLAMDLDTMTPTWRAVFPPLTPWFSSVFMWDAVGLGARTAFVGLGDGRTLLFGSDGVAGPVLSFGVPVTRAGVPIAAGVGFGAMVGDDVVFATTETNIPYGSADPSLRPPSAHPAEYTLHRVGPDGTPRWSRAPGVNIAGVVPDDAGTQLLVGGGPRTSDARTDAFGALILDPSTGSTVTHCPTEGPVYFRPVWAADGRIAVSEGPYQVEGEVRGAYRLTVFR